MNLLNWAKGNYLGWTANRAQQQLLSRPLIDTINPEARRIRHPEKAHKPDTEVLRKPEWRSRQRESAAHSA